MRASLQPADPVFSRLLQDITLAVGVTEKIKHGIISANTNQLNSARELKERASQHLLEYLSAVAFACDASDDEDTLE